MLLNPEELKEEIRLTANRIIEHPDAGWYPEVLEEFAVQVRALLGYVGELESVNDGVA